MAVGLFDARLYLPMNDSLKGKQKYLEAANRTHPAHYNVSVCAGGGAGRADRAVLEVACVSTNGTMAHHHLQDVPRTVSSKQWHGGAQLIDYYIRDAGLTKCQAIRRLVRAPALPAPPPAHHVGHGLFSGARASSSPSGGR